MAASDDSKPLIVNDDIEDKPSEAASILSESPSPHPTRPLNRSSTPLLSAASSRTTSPKQSRETSPTRGPAKPNISASRTGATSRSRKNSQDTSPLRANNNNNTTGPSIPTVPSAAAVQRALSAAGPHLPAPPTPNEVIPDIQRPPKNVKSPSGSGAHTGPSNSRVSSPPPSTGSKISKPMSTGNRKVDQSQSTPSTPSIVVDRPSRGAANTPNTAEPDGNEEDYFSKTTGMRTPMRGISGGGPALETVQEASLPATPVSSALAASKPASSSKMGTGERPERIDEEPSEEKLSSETKPKQDSGNESSGNRSGDIKSSGEGKEPKKATAPNSSKPATMQSKKSFTQMPPKSKTASSEGSIKNMTVETETVSSIPQVALGGGAGERNLPHRTDTTGTVRLKPSNETIRPKKEKKKAARKAPSLHAGTGRSNSFACCYHQHHHRLYHGAASPRSALSLSLTPSSPGFSRWSRHDDPSVGPRSIHRTDRQLRVSIDSDEHSPTTMQSPLKRKRSILTPFRGHSASSKADIFEAKVATAVGEADSSDSEETFVYESNPPEPPSARQHRFHSRTPSTTSVVSQIDYHKGRQDGHHSLVGKKSMKFSNNYSSMGHNNEGDGTVRGPSQTGRGSHHHHIGRHGRDGRPGHPSLFDNESPFSNTSKQSRFTSGDQGNAARQSPKTSHFLKVSNGSRKAAESSSYDLEGEGADDERTPLVGTNRIGRNRRRPIPGSVRAMYITKQRSGCGRVTAFVALGSILAALIAAIVVILIMCSKPLVDVHIKDIRNVLASESELMLDLHVHAINPNLVAVQINDLDVNIFAKSKHVNTMSRWHSSEAHAGNTIHPPPPQPYFSTATKKKRRQVEASPDDIKNAPPILSDPEDIISHLLDGTRNGDVDEGTDPISPPWDDSDPASDSQTMLLGQIFSFDSPLSFDPSPINYRPVSSVGEVRLAKPGNRTEEGGSQRWEHVLQHDFELIVRGVLRYSPPVSSLTRRVTVHGSVIVHPNEEEDDGTGNMKLSPPPEKGKKGVDEGSNVVVTPPPIRIKLGGVGDGES